MKTDGLLTVVLVGIGGYGNVYLEALLGEGPRRGVRLGAAVEPAGGAPAARARLRAAGVTVHDHLAEALRSEPVDLVVIAAPIHRHAPDAILAFEHGAHVLCEKPLAGCVADAEGMVRTAAACDRWLAVGFQWAFADAVCRCRADLRNGRWGRVRALRGRVLWPRAEAYYERNAWAGRARLPTGEAVQDSPVANAAAHFLHVLLHLLDEPEHPIRGGTRLSAARLWRCHDIETFDSAALELAVGRERVLTFVCSHTPAASIGPELEIRCERGRLRFSESDGGWVGEADSSGERTVYGWPDGEGHAAKLWVCVQALRSGGKPASGLAAALTHLDIVDALAQQPVTVVPAREYANQRWTDGSVLRVTPGVEAELNRWFESAPGFAPAAAIASG